MKKYFFILVPLAISIGCFVAYSVIGSRVDSGGVLIEPFALIPLGYLFFCIALVSGVVLVVLSFLKKKRV